MPGYCAALSCSNQRTADNRARGITFHKFPKDEAMRKKWEVALRREGFTANDTSVVCSEHFRPTDFDRTGQTVQLRDSVIPSIFSSPVHLQRGGTTATSIKAEESLSVAPQDDQEASTSHSAQPNDGQYKAGLARNVKIELGSVPTLQGQTIKVEAVLLHLNPLYLMETPTQDGQLAKYDGSSTVIHTGSRSTVSVGTQYSVPSKPVATQLSLSTLKPHVRSKATQTGPCKRPEEETVSQNPAFQLVYIPAKRSAPPQDSRVARTPGLEVPADNVENISVSLTQESGDSVTQSHEVRSKTDDSELKCVVFESCLRELFQTCPVCERDCEVQRQRLGTCVSFTQLCTGCQYSRKWQSEPLSHSVTKPQEFADQRKSNTEATDRRPGLYRCSDALSDDSPTEKVSPQHIVDEESILQLMKNCPVCNKRCRCTKRTHAPYLIVYQSCYFCQYQRKFVSQPEAQILNVHTTKKRKRHPKEKIPAEVPLQA